MLLKPVSRYRPAQNLNYNANNKKHADPRFMEHIDNEAEKYYKSTAGQEKLYQHYNLYINNVK